MTAYPIPENASAWWLTTRRAWSRLHAVPGDSLTVEDHREGVDTGDGVERRTACGRTLRLVYAGMFSRFSMPRCESCCRKLGIPPGDGTPVNEAAEKRLAAEAAEKREDGSHAARDS